MLSFLFTAGTLTGFDASGHIAEETKNASVVAARGILSSAIATGLISFTTIILYLFCTPPIDVWFTLDAPQPFVQIYALSLGKGGAVVMTIIAIVGLVLVRIAWFIGALSLIQHVLEYKYCHRGCIATNFCHRSRWSSPWIEMDWQSYRRWTTKTRRDRHVRIWRYHTVHHIA